MNHINEKNRIVTDYLKLSLATLLIALAVKEYLIPCQIVTGSVSGLALLLSEILPVGSALMVLVLNVLCLAVGFYYLGKRFGIRCIYISLLLPILIKIIPQTNYLLSRSSVLNILIFLVLLTLGQCMMLELDTTSGGLDTIGEVLAKKLHTSTGLMIGAIGCAVSVMTVGVYGIKTAAIGAIATILNGIMINVAEHLIKAIPLKLRKLQAFVSYTL